jgi:hypothetical protein
MSHRAGGQELQGFSATQAAHVLEQQLVRDEGLALLEGWQRVAAAPARVGVHVQPVALPHHQPCVLPCT